MLVHERLSYTCVSGQVSSVVGLLQAKLHDKVSTKGTIPVQVGEGYHQSGLGMIVLCLLVLASVLEPYESMPSDRRCIRLAGSAKRYIKCASNTACGNNIYSHTSFNYIMGHLGGSAS